VAKRLAKRVLLIGWDAADWKLITPLLDAGQLPSLEGLIDRGVMGNLASLDPMLSPMLWTSIVTGKRADKHGILGFVEPDPGGGGLRPVSSTSRRTKALWNMLHQRGMRSGVVGWFASHPAEPVRGAVVTNLYQRATAPPDEPWPLPAGTVHPPALTSALAELRVHPAELEPGHILPFIPHAAEVDQENDPRLGACARILAECASVHAAATHIMEHEPWDLLAIYHDAIDHLGHAFMQYHPPRQPHVTEDDFRLYRDVVTGAYRFHDMMLGRMLELAPPDTAVILLSDHGFHSDHLRPRDTGRALADGPAGWHRQHGVLVMAGPGIRGDERIYGAGLLDITPTALALLGLPVGDDMEGRVLTEAFTAPPEIDRIPSWDDVPGDAGMHPPERSEDAWEAREALRQLEELGYVDPVGDDERASETRAERDRRHNLARVHLDAGRHREAAALLDALVQEDPADVRSSLYLAQCRYLQGELAGCRHVVERLLAGAGDRPLADLLMGALLLAEGEGTDALLHLRRAEKAEPRLPALHTQIGNAYLRTRAFADAERAFRRALEIDGDSANAYHGLAVALLAQHRDEEAAEHALRAVGLVHHFPRAHMHLGMALARMGWTERAREALEAAVRMRPDLEAAHSWLDAIRRELDG
jgi:tetratricopeptide (TPR) repeat protein